MSSTEPKEKRSLFRLIGDLPGLVGDLIRAEIESIKKEIVTKLASLGIGVGLLAGAAFVLFFVIATLIAAAVLGIATALPACVLTISTRRPPLAGTPLARKPASPSPISTSPARPR